MSVKIGADAPGTAVQLIGDTVAPRILMIVTDKDSLDSDTEVPLRRDLVSRFNAQVDVAQSDTDIDAGSWDLARYDLIIVCNGVVPTDVNNLKTVEVPVLSLDEDVSVTALNMAATGGTATAETQTNATDITHQIISEAIRSITPSSIVAGNKTVYRTSSSADFITTLGAGGVSLAEDTVTATEEQIAIYEEDAVLQDASLAAEMRLHFGLYQFNQLNAMGKALFRQVVEYTIYGGSLGIVEVEADVDAILVNQDNNVLFGHIYKVQLPQGQPLGDAFFVDGDTGVDTNNGESWTNAVLTIDYSISLTAADRWDYIFVAPKTAASGLYDENANTNGVAIDVQGTRVIASSGSRVNVENSNGAATAVFSVLASDVELANFWSSEDTATVEGIVISGGISFTYIHHNYLAGTMENAIQLSATGFGHVIEWNDIYLCTDDGIELSGLSNRSRIMHNIIYAVGGNGINVSGAAASGFTIMWNQINGRDVTDYAIVLAGDECVCDYNTMGRLATQPVLISGTDNLMGQNNTFDKYSGSYNRTVANGTTEITSNVTGLDLPANGKYEFQWDLSTLVSAGEGGNVDCYLYGMPGVAFIRRDVDRMIIGTDVVHPTCEKGFQGEDNQLQEGLQCSVAVTTDRLIRWMIVKTGG